MTLRHVVLLRGLLDLTPAQANLAAFAATVLCFKAWTELLCRLRSRNWLSAPYSRDLAHVAMSASCAVSWPLYDPSHRATAGLAALAPAVLAARYLYKGALTKDPEDAEVRALSRSSSPGELLHGPAQCAAALAWTGWKLLGSPESAVLAASLAVADGLAPMAGRWYGRHAAGGRSSSYPSYQRRHLPSHQRAEGTVAGALVGTALCTYLYQWLMGFPPLPLRLVLAYGGIAAVVGALLKGADNLAVPVALHLLMPRVQGWLSA